jgi:zinc transporter ZupT
VPIDPFLAVILASVTAAVVTSLGILVISRYGAWGTANATYFKAFAAGVLIGVSLLHLIPESLHANEGASVYLLAGFLMLYLLNRFLHRFICHEGECAPYAVGLLPVLAIGLHSLVDGVIHAVTFNVSIFTGAVAALGMVLHEFPEGIVSFVLLRNGGLSRRKAMLIAFLAAAVTTPLGALLAFPFVDRVGRALLDNLLALSAGALVYVGASHLLPDVEAEARRSAIIALLAGTLVAIGIVLTRH